MDQRVDDALLVGFDYYPEGNDRAVLIIGRKQMNESIEIINAFGGKEAIELYEKLTKREK